MPLSTSSSNVRARQSGLPLGRLWIGTLVIALVIGCAIEVGLRAGGHQITVADNAVVWAMERWKIDHGDSRKQIAIVGGSRGQMGLNPAVMEELLPGYKAIMLAVDGSNCLPTLYDLAYRSDFKGIIICSFTASYSLSGGDTQQQWAQNYHRMVANGSWINAMLDQGIRTWLQEHFVISGMAAFVLFKNILLEQQLPEPHFEHMLGSRFRPADFYAKGDQWLARYRKSRVARLHRNFPIPDEQVKTQAWEAMIVRLKAAVQRIEDRGGKVLLIRMPTTGGHFAHINSIYPREKYWDTLSKRVGANTLYFKDAPELSSFTCPDTSHLNYDDADRFTKALINRLKSEKIFE